ncbi:M15 family metallopeptidase [Nocardioides caeni]|uniref:M15 family metallopeptidase n=1 Tax=Nocardioides caeni TaxID=574700 RepID=A0A4S8NNC1_9ACTN|nr:M15 family metallopeptidase [Nocardioides caeni]THV18095.1 M15 family metallopeptidase [Nocardioides caeni]
MALAVLPGLAGTASAAAPAITLAAPAAAAGASTSLTVTVADEGAPVPGASVDVERWDGAAWQPVTGSPVVAGADGRAAVDLVVDRAPARNRVRASYDGVTGEHQLTIRPVATRTTITARSAIVDGRRMYLRMDWRTTAGDPVPAGKVVLQRRLDGRWRTVGTFTTNEAGWARVLLRPRVDSRFRAIGHGNAWAQRSISATHLIDNRPPGVPVRLPAGAPSPRVRLPAQARASTAGADAVVTAIPAGVWNSMVGRSWHRGCPVGRSGLRLLRINYWDYHGYRRRGELVAAAGVVHQMAGALAEMYAARLPIRSMYRVDRFGWSGRLQGADDYRSMAAGNSSAFNCRWVVGRGGVRSPHSYGRSLDINTWENPYRSSHGWVPNAWWPSRSNARVAWRSSRHQVVRIMARHGLRWTYGNGDSQHFDAVPRHGRLLVVPGCEGVVCH